MTERMGYCVAFEKKTKMKPISGEKRALGSEVKGTGKQVLRLACSSF